jgi:hypothetical protein
VLLRIPYYRHSLQWERHGASPHTQQEQDITISADYLILADAAAAVAGKHYIHGGGWDTIQAASFPVTHHAMSAAIRLRVPWTATNQPHDLELDIVDADGQSVLPNPPGPFTGQLNIGRPPHLEPGEDQVVPLVMDIRSLVFVAPGSYAAILRIGGFEAMRSPFRLVQIGETIR